MNLPPDRARFGPKPAPTLRNLDLLLGLYARLLPGSSRRHELLAQCDRLLDQRNALCHHRTNATDTPPQSAIRNPQSEIK